MRRRLESTGLVRGDDAQHQAIAHPGGDVKGSGCGESVPLFRIDPRGKPPAHGSDSAGRLAPGQADDGEFGGTAHTLDSQPAHHIAEIVAGCARLDLFPT